MTANRDAASENLRAKSAPDAVDRSPADPEARAPAEPEAEQVAADTGPAEPGTEDVAATAPANPVRKIVLVALGFLLLLYVYGVASDRVTPYSSQAAIDIMLVQIAPEITGRVVEVGVIDNARVRRGQVLFRVDREPFEIALRAAEAELASAIQAEGVSASEVSVAQAQLQKNRVDLAASRELGGIITGLVDEGALARTSAIRARADVAKGQADVERASAEVERARRNLGSGPGGNPRVRQALAALAQARLDLSNTTVTAPADGVVTNLRLSAGQFVQRGQPLLSFVNSGPRWISAAMRENQLGNLAPGNPVLVVLDDTPGRVFRGRVESVGWGVAQGDEAPTGQLPSVEPTTGWLREPQRFPVRIVLMPDDEDEAVLAVGRSGAQANVIVLTGRHPILNPIARLRIRLVAWLSYLR